MISKKSQKLLLRGSVKMSEVVNYLLHHETRLVENWHVFRTVF